MKNKDVIKDLFNERFTDFESSVDPSVWTNVKSGLSSPAPSVGSSSVIGGSTSLIVAAVSIVVASIFGVNYYVDSNNDDTAQVVTQNETPISITESKIAPVEKVSIVIPTNSIERTIKEETKENESESQNLSIKSTKGENTDVTPSEIIQIEKVLVSEKTEISNDPVVSNQSVEVSIAPSSINIKEQSRVVASPMGGKAPLSVSFNSVAEVKNIKWKFDDGTESIDVSPNHVYETPGIYIVTMLAELEDGSVVMDKAVIEVKEASKAKELNSAQAEIVVPNVITPNGDGINDELKINCKSVASISVSIYSRNGKLVYQSINPEENWDGTDLQGNQLQDGVFYYLINAIGEDESVYVPKGYITLKR